MGPQINQHSVSRSQVAEILVRNTETFDRDTAIGACTRKDCIAPAACYLQRRRRASRPPITLSLPQVHSDNPTQEKPVIKKQKIEKKKKKKTNIKPNTHPWSDIIGGILNRDRR